jgi:hypothetical protein
MRKNIIQIVLPVSILLIALLFTGCNAFLVKVPDQIETRQFDSRDFTAIDIGNAFYYEINRADTYSVSITAGVNLLEHIHVAVQGDTLKIDIRPSFNIRTLYPMEAIITMPYLYGLESSGATEGHVSGFNSTENASIQLSGASDLVLTYISAGDLSCELSGASTLELNDVKTNDANFTLAGASDLLGSLTAADTGFFLSGASTVRLKGTGNDMKIDASGASDIELAAFPVRNADITLSGGSECEISPKGTLDIDASGASEIIYYGNPSISSIDIGGGSEVIKK